VWPLLLRRAVDRDDNYGLSSDGDERSTLHIRDVATGEDLPERIPDSRLVVLPGDSFHVAVTDPERCATVTLEFLSSHPMG